MVTGSIHVAGIGHRQTSVRPSHREAAPPNLAFVRSPHPAMLSEYGKCRRERQSSTLYEGRTVGSTRPTSDIFKDKRNHN